jgi:hypothetical protein
MVSQADDPDFSVSIPSVDTITIEADSSADSAASTGSSWFGGFVSLPKALTGGSTEQTYTAYHVVTIFKKESS